MNTNPVTIHATVDVAESIRRGKPAAVSYVRIPLAELVALIDPTERDALASCVSNLTNQGQTEEYHLRHPLTGYHFGNIPTADAAGLVEAFRAAQAQKAARVAAELAAPAAADELVRENPGVAVHSWGEIHQVYVSGVRAVAFDELSPESQALVLAESNRLKSEAAAKAAAEAAAKSAADLEKQQNEEKRRTRLVPHMNVEEREMLIRDYLRLADVETRLNDEAIERLRAKIEPPDYEIDFGAGKWKERKPACAEEFRMLRRIEQLAGLSAQLVNRGYCNTTYAAVELEIPTVDGRTLIIHITA